MQKFTVDIELNALSVILALLLPIVFFYTARYFGFEMSMSALYVGSVVGVLWGRVRVFRGEPGEGEGK